MHGRARLLCSALLREPVFASFVLREQLLGEPTLPCTWLPPSLPPPSPRGSPGEEWERRGWEEGLPEEHRSPHLSTWQKQAPPSQTEKLVRSEQGALCRSSPKDSRPGLGEWGRGWFVRNMMCGR